MYSEVYTHYLKTAHMVINTHFIYISSINIFYYYLLSTLYMEICLIVLQFKYIIYHSQNICLCLTFHIIFTFHLYSVTPSGLILHMDSILKDNHVSVCTFYYFLFYYLQNFYINKFKIDFKWLQKKI